MRGSNVETVPGGLRDLLLEYSPREDLRDALARGRANRALRILEGLSPTEISPIWTYFAAHSAQWLLPDDGALPPVDPVDPRSPALEWPAQDTDQNGDPLSARIQALVAFCVGARNVRALLAPHFESSNVPDPTGPYSRAMAVLTTFEDQVRDEEEGLQSFSNLVSADLHARWGNDEWAWGQLDAAEEGFTDTKRWGSAAAVWVTRGDWLACPCGSPSSWGLSLGSPTSDGSSLRGRDEWPEQQSPVDPEGAADAYDRAEALYRRAGSRRGAAHLIWRRAYLLFARGELTAAADLAAEAAVLLAACGDDAAALTARTHATLAALSGGLIPPTQAVVKPIAAWARGDGSVSHAIGLGRLYARTGQRLAATVGGELALAASAVAEGIWKALDRPISRAQTLVDQAKALQSLGARRPALVAAETALDLVDQAEPGGRLVENTWMLKSSLLSRVYDLATDIDDLDAADRAKRRITNFRPVIQEIAKRKVGRNYRQNTATHAEFAQIFLARQRLKNLPSIDSDVDVLLTRAERARDDGDQLAAKRYIKAAARAARSQRFGLAPGWLALVRLQQRRYAAAARLARIGARRQLSLAASLRWQRTASTGRILARALLRFIQPRRLEALALLGNWYVQRTGRPTGAFISADEASVLRLERSAHDSALTMGLLSKDYDLARKHLDALKQLANPWWDGLGRPWDQLDTEGRLLEAEGDLESALSVFQQAVGAAEAARRRLRRDDLRIALGSESHMQLPYLDAARVALRLREQYDPSDRRRDEAGWTAVEMLELSRSRALTDLLDSSDAGLPTSTVTAWRGAQATVDLANDRLAATLDVDEPDPDQVRARRTDLERADRDLAEQTGALRAADPRFWQLSGPRKADPTDVRGAASGLADGELLVVFGISGPAVVSIVLDRAGVVSGWWSREQPLHRLAGRFVEACAGGDATWEQVAKELGTILLEPHADALLAARQLRVVASGALLGIPFSALCLRGRVLGEHLVVSMLPNIGSYPHLVDQRRTEPALCVGDPDGMAYHTAADSAPRPLRDLPGARLEARAIAAIHHVDPLVGADATEAAVRERLPTAAVAHLATHGLIDPTSALASSVQLAFGDELTVAEVLALRIDADLVVLSACQTGTGARPAGEEILGLARAFLAAGARSVLVTLWPVRDDTTAVVMKHVHEHRLAGRPTSQALAEAQHLVSRMTPRALRAELAELQSLAAPTSPHNAFVPPPAPPVLRLVTPFEPGNGTPTTSCDHPMIWAPFILIGGTSSP